MGKINPCMKRLFIFFNLLFAIAGGVLIALAMLSQVAYHEADEAELETRTNGAITLYAVGGITMVMALLGAYGAYKEKKIPLIVFLSAMCVGSLGLLRVAIPLAVARPEIDDAVEMRFKALVPLDNNNQDIKNMANQFQSMFQCCGLFAYTDWYTIPESCSCNPDDEEEEGLCHRVSYKKLYSYTNDVISKDIYKQTCFPILMSYVSMAADITVGILFGFASLALLGAVMSTIMLLQLRSIIASRPPVIFSIPTFSSQPPKYTELYNTAEK